MWIKVPKWRSLLCLSLVSFRDREFCWEDPNCARREGQAIAVFLTGLDVELGILQQSIQTGQAQGSKVSVTLPQGQYSSVSVMLVCLHMTTGRGLPSPPGCKFLLKFWISSFVAMWNENQTKQNNNDYTAGGTGQPMCCHCFSEFLWLTVAIAYFLP